MPPTGMLANALRVVSPAAVTWPMPVSASGRGKNIWATFCSSVSEVTFRATVFSPVAEVAALEPPRFEAEPPPEPPLFSPAEPPALPVLPMPPSTPRATATPPATTATPPSATAVRRLMPGRGAACEPLPLFAMRLQSLRGVGATTASALLLPRLRRYFIRRLRMIQTAATTESTMESTSGNTHASSSGSAVFMP